MKGKTKTLLMIQEISRANKEIISRDVESAPVWYVTNKSQGVQFEINQLLLIENIGALVRPLVLGSIIGKFYCLD